MPDKKGREEAVAESKKTLSERKRGSITSCWLTRMGIATSAWVRRKGQGEREEEISGQPVAQIAK